MLAFLILIAAALSRLLPHALHGVGINLTAVGAGLLFFGSRRPRREAVFAAALMAITDVYLTTVVYGYSFHVRSYLITWAWYAAVCLMGSGLLGKVTALRVAAGVFASATSFFLVSNFMVWVTSRTYPHNAGGLGTCFVAGLPFYGNDLVSTALVSGVLFGLPIAAARLAAFMQSAHNQPLA